MATDLNLGSKYTVIQKLGQGSFGEIYQVLENSTGSIYAAQIEKQQKKGLSSLVQREAKIMKELAKEKHFPRIIDSSSNEYFHYLIMSCLGPNLQMIKKQMGGRLSLKSVLLISIQMLTAIENLHTCQFIHRDIKPENFVIGSEREHFVVYLIDFGLTKNYIDLHGKHIPPIENQGLVGTVRYTSINSHKGIEQSRRDDLESIGYVLVYLHLGVLPWQNIVSDNRKEKFNKIWDIKKNTSHEELCSKFPKCFRQYMGYVKSLKYDEEPNYYYLRQMFLDCYQSLINIKQVTMEWCNQVCDHPEIIEICNRARMPTNADITDICKQISEHQTNQNGIQHIPNLHYRDEPLSVSKKLSFSIIDEDSTKSHNNNFLKISTKSISLRSKSYVPSLDRNGSMCVFLDGSNGGSKDFISSLDQQIQEGDFFNLQECDEKAGNICIKQINTLQSKHLQSSSEIL